MTATVVPNDAPARGGAARRAAHRARYAWANSGDPRLLAARRRWECRPRPTVPGLVSPGRDGGPTIAYAGTPEGVRNVLAFLEQQRDGADMPTPERVERDVTWADLAAGTAFPEADLVAVGADAARVAGLPTAGALVLPFRVHLVVEVDDDLDGMRRRISKREREDFRRSRRDHGWTWERDDSPAAFEHFFERMHRPTMEERHGDRQRSEGPDAAYECLFRRGMLFFVAEGGRRVAGVLCRWDGATGTLTTRLLGVLDGAPEHYASGAFKAVYHLLLEWACANGVERIDYHGTEAFVSKGIYQWKRKFRPTVVLPPNHFAGKRLWFRPARDTEAVRDFLVANPTLAMTGDGGMEAVYFRDGTRPPRTGLSWECPGVAGAREIDLDEFLAPAGARRKERT
ncbi:MAG TPA: GNAT family N-acetyltransferase [Acidimicrobiales bacterium]|jgi:hypothetical protein